MNDVIVGFMFWFLCQGKVNSAQGMSEKSQGISSSKMHVNTFSIVNQTLMRYLIKEPFI